MSQYKDVVVRLGLAVAALVCVAGAASARNEEKLMIPVGHAQVVLADDAVKTVAIAEPKIADAAVGSERTVVVNGKQAGTTSLVVYGEGGRFRVYEVEVFTPNSDKQVALHVRVAEVNDQAKRQLGIDVIGSGSRTKNGHFDVLAGGLFTGNLGNEIDGLIHFEHDPPNLMLEAAWRALEEKGDIRLLANPTLVARSGNKASFLAGGEFPVPVASASANNATTITIQWRQYGVKVEFTPTVEADGGILLEVTPEVSQLNFSTPLSLNGFVVPSIDTRRTTTTVKLNPGEHLVIGGLKQTEATKIVRRVPILGQIPILSALFSYTRNDKVDRELMVVVSPEMLEAASQTLPELPTDRK